MRNVPPCLGCCAPLRAVQSPTPTSRDHHTRPRVRICLSFSVDDVHGLCPGRAAAGSRGLEPEVLIGWEGIQGDGVDGMLGDPRSDPMQGPKVQERRKHHPLHRELLDAMQQGLPGGPVALARLLLKQRIDRLCRKFCSGGREGAVAPHCEGIKQPGSRTIRPQ